MNRHKHLVSLTTQSRTEPAMATPSCVLVPRPSSSRITRERGVADLRIVDVSESSTMKVDWFVKRESNAPIRV